jgi:imidazolonepropionase-like amidohydrolase
MGLPICSGRGLARYFFHGQSHPVFLEASMSRWKKLPSCLLLTAYLLVAAESTAQEKSQESRTTGVTVFEGARLITGDGSGAIENSAFIVANGRFNGVGRRGKVQVPAGAMRVDLAGKTVMPAMVDLHGHIGFQNVSAGTMSKETYTRENLIDHLQRLAYHGVGAIVSIGDLVSRSDLRGGRTDWGDVPLRMRDEVVPGAALFRTAGPGMAWPGAGAQGHVSRADVMYPVTTAEEAREAVRDYVRMKPSFIKIWVDDRGGRVQTLTPPLYRAIIAEAHKHNVAVGVHNVTAADAKELMRAGVEGWLHVPVRQGEAVDDELIAIVKQRIARNERPTMWMTPALRSTWMTTQGGRRPAWLDDPLLRATYSPQDIQAHWGSPLAKMSADLVERARRNLELDGSNAMKLRAAGMRIVTGTDTGQTRFWIGYFNHLELESLVAIGMTPAEAIVAATRDAAEIAGVNAGIVAAGRSADFIVLDANPLENISNTRRIDKVYLRGQEVPRTAFAAKWQAEFRRTALE